MKGYIKSLFEFLNDSEEAVVSKIMADYPEADNSQIQSWKTLIKDLKSVNKITQLPIETIIGIEYELPISGMAVDVIICGYDKDNNKVSYIIESKQWADTYINQVSFSSYREEGKELHPQIQVSRHKLGFYDYTNIGHEYKVYPFVFIRNCSQRGIEKVLVMNPAPKTKEVTITNDLGIIFDEIANTIVSSNNILKNDLINAEYKPSKDIILAMKSILTREEPFILTSEQLKSIDTIKKSIVDGKKIIRVMGPAGSGKTAILLNLYVELLNNKETSNLRPIFISGAQNTAYYRSAYPEIENSFGYSFSLEKSVAKTKGNLYVILMDEAQHNQEGIITNMINRGATLIMCYDVSQIINADNALKEIKAIETRDDFVSIELKDSVRFNGSQIAKSNIKEYLRGGNSLQPDEKFDFKTFSNFKDFQKQIFETIAKNPNSSFAVTGLLSNDSKKYTLEENPDSKLFAKWGNKTECEWMPYINSKDYLVKNDGNLWVGTWWMPGLDVDYVAVLVGGDAKLTKNGLVAIPEQAKHFRMMISIARQMDFPKELFLEKKVFGKIGLDSVNTTKKIIEYINKNGNESIKNKFIDLFSKLLRNNYYIMMSRGRKGCYVYFAINETIN